MISYISKLTPAFAPKPAARAVFFFCAVVLAAGLASCAQPDHAPPVDPAGDVQEPASPDVAKTETPPADDSALGEISFVDKAGIARLLEEARGKVLVVNVWATYCIPCREETPELVTFYKNRDPEKVAYLSISSDFLGDPIEDYVKPFAREFSTPFPIYVQNPASPAELLEALDVETDWSGALPITFIFNAAGENVYEHQLAISLEELEAAVAAAAQT